MCVQVVCVSICVLVWFGGRLSENLVDVEWISTGQQATYSRWGAGEPSLLEIDDGPCVAAWFPGQARVEWFVENCEATHQAICEYM
jgi:hypothetical protein